MLSCFIASHSKYRLVPMQAVLLDMYPAQLRIQSEYQTFVFKPSDQEQIMQIVVFVAMFIGAVWFFLRNIKPFLVLFATVRSVITFMTGSPGLAAINSALSLPECLDTAGACTPHPLVQLASTTGCI